MPWENASAVRLKRLFLEGFSVMDLAIPLVSFDAGTPAAAARALMEARGFDLVGVRRDGLVAGYARREELDAGACGDHLHPFTADDLVDETAPLLEVIRSLAINERCFVTVLGEVGAIVTLSDLEKPPMRMFLFGMITILEMLVVRLIRERCAEEEWRAFITPERLQKAEELQRERQRRGQEVDLLDCLQFSDKGRIILRHPELRGSFASSSQREAKTAIKELEALRNNLAHTQLIIPSGWQRIIVFSSRLEAILEGMAAGDAPPITDKENHPA